MFRISIASLFVLIVSLGAAFAESTTWTTITRKDMKMEVPSFMVDGYQNAILLDGRDIGTNYSPVDSRISSFAVYSVTTPSRPYQYLINKESDSLAVSYHVDKKSFGVISWSNRGMISYNACKRVSNRLTCFDLQYPEKSQDIIDDALPRMLKTFKKY
jgi:hypothetical protein